MNNILQEINLTKLSNIYRWIDRFNYARSIAIDISRSKISFAYIDKNITGLNLLEHTAFDVDIRSDGKLTHENEAMFLTKIGLFVRKIKIESDIEIVIGLPRSQIIFKFIEIPSPDESNIKEILKFEIDKYLPISKEDILYDFEVINRKDGNLYDVMLVAVRKNIVDYYLTLCRKIQLVPSIASTSILAGVNLYRLSENNGDATRVLLEVEKKSVHFSLISDGKVLWTKKTSIIQENLINAFDKNESGNLIKECGDFIADEYTFVRSAVRSIGSTKEPNGLVFVKNNHWWQKLKDYLNDEKGLEVTILHPLSKVRSKTAIMENDQSAIIPAVGLALSGVSSFFSNVNLVPDEFKRKGRGRHFILTICLLSAFVFLLLTSTFAGYVKDKMFLSKINAELKQVKQKVMDIEGVGMKTEELVKRIGVFNDIKKQTISKLKVIKELSALIPPSVWIANMKVYNDEIELSGYAQRASDLIKILEDSTFFYDVKFAGTIKKDKGREKFKIIAGLDNNLLRN